MKSIKLKNDNYFDSSGITHDRELLSTILSNIKDNKSNYMKLENGTLICWGKTNKYNISYNYTENVDITLPASYKDANFIVLTSISDTGAYWANGLTTAGYSMSKNTARVFLSNYQINAIIQNVSACWLTIGKWK